MSVHYYRTGRPRERWTSYQSTELYNIASAMASVDDLYQLLEEKENDLHLAAELGKALLERNESLTREYEKHCSDSTQQLEVTPYCLWLVQLLQWLKVTVRLFTNFNRIYVEHLTVSSLTALPILTSSLATVYLTKSNHGIPPNGIVGLESLAIVCTGVISMPKCGCSPAVFSFLSDVLHVWPGSHAHPYSDSSRGQ